MSASEEKGYGYLYLFEVTVLFSALATASFLSYVSLRGGSLSYELFMVGVLLCVSFSALGERIGKINQIGKWIFFISAFSISLTHRLFFNPLAIATIWIDIPYYAVIFLIFGSFALWSFLSYIWSYLCRKRMTKKPLAVIIASMISAILGSYFALTYTATIVSFFDTHPWAMTFIAILVTSVLAFIGGRRSLGKKTS
jgi:hypothetical protein